MNSEAGREAAQASIIGPTEEGMKSGAVTISLMRDRTVVRICLICSLENVVGGLHWTESADVEDIETASYDGGALKLDSPPSKSSNLVSIGEVEETTKNRGFSVTKANTRLQTYLKMTLTCPQVS